MPQTVETKLQLVPVALLAICSLQSARVQAATTITPTNHLAYAANLGWLDWRGDTNTGAIISEYVCSGYVYSANGGWIYLGSGLPANHIQYQNNSATDCGVNHDSSGKLTGYAYGANIGWINFEQTYGQPMVNLKSGNLSGYVYSANCGWISLSNATARVQTANIPAGADTDGDGLTDAWELIYTNSLAGFNASGDADGDGVSNLNEYLAGTNPNDSNDVLKITAYFRDTPSPTYNLLTWNSKPSRCYVVLSTTNLATAFSDFVSLPILGWNNVGFNTIDSERFYRIRAYRPLTP